MVTVVTFLRIHKNLFPSHDLFIFITIRKLFITCKIINNFFQIPVCQDDITGLPNIGATDPIKTETKGLV